jgi:hypothetical protein
VLVAVPPNLSSDQTGKGSLTNLASKADKADIVLCGQRAFIKRFVPIKNNSGFGKSNNGL